MSQNLHQHSDKGLSNKLSSELSPFTRRRFLKYSLAATVASTTFLQGCATALFGEQVQTRTREARYLNNAEYDLLIKLRDVLLPTNDTNLPSPVDVPVMRNIDEMVGRLTSRVRGDFALALRFFNISPYMMSTKFKTVSGLDNDEVHKYVEAWQNGLFVQRGIMTSIKTVVYMAYWRDPRTWPSLEYDGPVTEKWGIPRLGNEPLPLV